MVKDIVFIVFVVLVMYVEFEFSRRTPCFCNFLLIVSRSWRLEFVLLSSPQLEGIVAIFEDECVGDFFFSLLDFSILRYYTSPKFYVTSWNSIHCNFLLVDCRIMFCVAFHNCKDISFKPHCRNAIQSPGFVFFLDFTHWGSQALVLSFFVPVGQSYISWNTSFTCFKSLDPVLVISL